MPVAGVRTRQARILDQAVILPQGIDAEQWYDIVPGRRHDDGRPGMVLLNVGGRMVHFPERCLEFRDRGRAKAPVATRPKSKSKPRLRRMVTTRQLAIAASLVPVGVAALVAVRLFVGDR